MQARALEEVAADHAAEDDLIADVLGERDDGHGNDERQHRPGNAAFHAEDGEGGDEIGHGEERRRGHPGKVDETQKQGQEVAADDAQQDRNHREETLEHQGEDEDRRQGEKGDQEMDQAIGIAGGGVLGHVDRDRGEPQADHHDDRADHDRGQQADQPIHAEGADRARDDEVDEPGAERAE